MSAAPKFTPWSVNWSGDMVSHGLPTIKARNGHKVAEVASRSRKHAAMLASGPDLATALVSILAECDESTHRDCNRIARIARDALAKVQS